MIFKNIKKLYDVKCINQSNGIKSNFQDVKHIKTSHLLNMNSKIFIFSQKNIKLKLFIKKVLCKTDRNYRKIDRYRHIQYI